MKKKFFFFFFSSRRRHTRLQGDWSSDVCSSDLAQTGKLAIWVGGDAAVFKKYEAVLRQIGDQPYYVGPIGAGTVAKLAHNAASFTVQAALAEVFTLGVKAGVEPLALFRALRQGASGRKRTF